MRIYAIGDVHGYLDQLEAAHDRIARDRAETGDREAPVVHLGDLVDRGPDSRGVVDMLVRGLKDREPWIVLAGNHDRVFSEQIGLGEAEFRLSSWLSDTMGGRATAASYDAELSGWRSEASNREKLASAVPKAHREFLRGLKLFYSTPDLLFVHAGIRPGLAMQEQIEDDLLWIRRDFLDDTRDHGRLVVHGHTPVEEPTHYGNRVNLDTGAGYGRPITVAVFEGRTCFVLEENGRRKLNALV
jgi:serine/threonine protein phosphatase 1